MSVPTYERYRDSGLEWLGEIPSHWDCKPIKAVASYNDEVLTDATAADYEIEYIEISDVEAGKGLTGTSSFLFSDAPSRARRRVRLGDVLVSTVRTYLKAIAPITDPLENWVASTGFVVVRPRLIQSGYIGYALQDSGFIGEVIARSVGVSYPAINASDLVSIKVTVPPSAEQAAIATFLDRETAKIDALVEEQQRLIDLLKEKRQAVISHAVTKGLDPSVPMKDSGVEWLGKVPAHWTVRPLKYIASFQSGGTPSKERADFWDGEIPWASAKDLKSDSISDTIDHLSSTAVECGAATLMPKGVVLVLVRGMMLARTFPVCETTVPMAINQDLKAVTGRQGVENSYLAWLFRGSSQETLNRLDEAGHGTKALRMEAWLSLPLPVPPQPEQAQIAKFVAKGVAQLDTLAEQGLAAIALLQARRSALISAAVTGKIDVRGLIPSDAEAA